jgi:hypothetical protein
MESESQ